MAKTLKQMLEVYKPKAADERKFMDKHVVVKHDDVNGNKDEVFQGTNVKTVDRKKERHGYSAAEDEQVYEEAGQVDEKLSPSQGAGEYIKDFQKSDAPQFKGKSKEKRRSMAVAAFMSAKKDMKEDVQIEEGVEAHAQFQTYHADTAKLLKNIHKGLSAHYDTVTDKKGYNNGMAHWGHVGDIKHIHRQLQDIHDNILQLGEYAKPVAVKEDVDQVEEGVDLTLLNLYMNLDEDNRVSMMKMLDEGHKDELLEFARTMESEE